MAEAAGQCGGSGGGDRRWLGRRHGVRAGPGLGHGVRAGLPRPGGRQAGRAPQAALHRPRSHHPPPPPADAPFVTTQDSGFNLAQLRIEVVKTSAGDAGGLGFSCLF